MTVETPLTIFWRALNAKLATIGRPEATFAEAQDAFHNALETAVLGVMDGRRMIGQKRDFAPTTAS